MKKELNFFNLFSTFIAETKSGKRLKKDGTRIKSGTLQHYNVGLTPYKLERFLNLI